MHGVTNSLGLKYYKKFKNLNNVIRLSIYEKKQPVFHECRALLYITITVQK